MKNQLEDIKKAEVRINNHLYIIASIVTLITMSMLLIEFFTKGRFSMQNMGVFYLGVLVIYSLHKELVRWLGKRKIERQGEIFVYTWIAITTILYIINFVSNNYYSFNFNGQNLYTLRDISILTIEVLAIFIFTRCLKVLKVFFQGL